MLRLWAHVSVWVDGFSRSQQAILRFDIDTEGASAIDIDTAVANNRRSRRDSQHSQTPYGENGEGFAMFDGPGHHAIPSSVSRMSYKGLSGSRSSEWERTRESQDSVRAGRGRRASMDSTMTNGETGAISGDEEDEVSLGTRRGRRLMRTSPQPSRSTVFENLAYLFSRNTVDESSRRRPSLSASSRHSRWSWHSDAGSDHMLDGDNADDDDGQERWGYSSGEEDDEEVSVHASDDTRSQSEADSGSYPTSPNSISLPLISADPIFGAEARIDIDLPLDTLDPPPPGPPSRQTIYIPDEDCNIRFVGYETIVWRQYLWRFGCILTCGILGLFGHWFPQLWIQWVTQEKAFIDAKHGFVVVEVGLLPNFIYFVP
jgi:cation-transporting ATPase 13A2